VISCLCREAESKPVNLTRETVAGDALDGLAIRANSDVMTCAKAASRLVEARKLFNTCGISITEPQFREYVTRQLVPSCDATKRRISAMERNCIFVGVIDPIPIPNIR